MNISEIMIRDVKYVTNHTPISKALFLIEKEHIKEIPVLSGGKVKGLITLHSIVTYPRNPYSLMCSKLMFRPPLLNENDDIFIAIEYMKKAGVEGLPVVKNEKLIGFVSDYDIIKALKKEFKGLLVNDFVQPIHNFLTLKDNILTARRLFYYSKIKSLPVVNEKNKLIGVLIENDLLNFLKPSERMGYGKEGEGDSVNFLNIPIKGILRKNYERIMIGEKITNIIDTMLNNHLNSIIVVDDENEPIGYVDRIGLINHLYESHKPRGVFLEFTGIKLDYTTNIMLTKVIQDHLNRINYLAKSIKNIKVQIKGLHEGEGVRKFELILKLTLNSGIVKRIKNVGYALRECLDEALTNIERLMKKDYKKSNP